MIAEAIDTIRQLAQQAQEKKREIGQLPDGRDYFTDDGSIIDQPSVDALKFSALTGFATYIDANRDNADLKRCVVHVCSPTHVELLTQLHPKYAERQTPAIATPALPQRHAFGQYIDAETATIWLLTGFVQDEATAAVLKVIGNLKAERVTTVADDGVTQVAAVRAGVSRTAEVEIHNPVRLRPYRTFPEVAQPLSPFVLRLREKEGGAPQIALFEGFDTTWACEAMASVAANLRAMILDKTIPVLA